MSTAYAIITFLPATTIRLRGKNSLKVTSLVSKLSEIVYLFLSWPSEKFNGINCVQNIIGAVG